MYDNAFQKKRKKTKQLFPSQMKGNIPISAIDARDSNSAFLANTSFSEINTKAQRKVLKFLCIYTACTKH